MMEIEVEGWSGDVGRAVAAAAEVLGLLISSDGSLRKYPDSRHWHLKKLGAAGTLEITYWPQRERLWVTYHSNRVGDGWVSESARRMAETLSGTLANTPGAQSETSGSM